MPNWCMNTLIVTNADSDPLGRAEALESFVKDAVGSDDDADATVVAEDGIALLSFQALYPMPEDKEQQLEEGKDCYLNTMFPSSNTTHSKTLDGAWYHWRIHHWGTKWTADSIRRKLTDHKATYTFCTAWCPPIPFMDKIAKDYPLLIFELRFVEFGNDFAGLFTWKSGAPVLKSEGLPSEFLFCREEYNAMVEEY